MPIKPSSALLAIVPALAADASPGTVEAALLPQLRIAAEARTITGKDDPEAVIGVLRAHATLAAEVPALRAQVAAESSRAEASERIQLLEAAVKEGLLKPGETWTWTEASDPRLPQIRGIAAVWGPPNEQGIGKTMAALRAELAHLRAVGPRTAAKTPAIAGKEPTEAELLAQASAAALSPAQLNYCAAHKLDPAKFAALLNASSR